LEKKTDEALPLLVPESRVDLQAGGNLPSAVSEALPIVGALAENAAGEDALPKVTKVAISQGGEVTLQLTGPIELRLGDPQQALKQKLKVAGTIIQQYLRDGKPLHYVDARVPERVAVKAQ
jgi:hypothetical protein